MNQQKIIAVSGIKNSGKTTLITRLIPVLRRRGHTVAVIKHDGHDFQCDIPGTDTYKFVEAGAYGTAIFSPYRIFMHKVETGVTERDLTGFFPDADILFLEGFKELPYPKIEIVRKEISGTIASEPEGRFLIVTNFPEGTFDDPCADIDDIEKIADIIEKLPADFCRIPKQPDA
ncbi:MAG: molybdopterin-guanine dinucleotide biosynthesis protein B [Bulleidia sp.]